MSMAGMPVECVFIIDKHDCLWLLAEPQQDSHRRLSAQFVGTGPLPRMVSPNTSSSSPAPVNSSASSPPRKATAPMFMASAIFSTSSSLFE
jgi:hypothetical protein